MEKQRSEESQWKCQKSGRSLADRVPLEARRGSNNQMKVKPTSTQLQQPKAKSYSKHNILLKILTEWSAYCNSMITCSTQKSIVITDPNSAKQPNLAVSKFKYI